MRGDIGRGIIRIEGSNVLERIDLCPLPTMAHRRQRVIISRGIDDGDDEDVEEGTSCPRGGGLRHMHLPK